MLWGWLGWLAGVRLCLGFRLDLAWISAGFLAFWLDLAGFRLWLDFDFDLALA